MVFAILQTYKKRIAFKFSFVAAGNLNKKTDGILKSTKTLVLLLYAQKYR